ncbi:MAG: zinc dependent phospholipase C family protein [Desulfatibacillum sp.]|nr:zinc dependent phospholipase C family protein [Desulfatibacillum sp.]
MPKEQTHWILASQACRRLENGRVRRMISQNPNLYLLGAVIPDTPMYALERAAEYDELAHHLHGKSGENTFAPLAGLVESYEGRWSDGMWAFVLGTLSHILADAVFHPWVEYYTGSSTEVPDDLKLLSLTRHRELESYLDLYYMRKSGDLRPKSFLSKLRAKEMDAAAFDHMVSTLYFQHKSTQKNGVRKALYAHGAIQWLFTQKTLARLAYYINGALDRKGDAWVSLFYPHAEPRNPAYFQDGITYRHTVTGRPKQGAVEDLTEKAGRVTARMFQLVEKHLDQGTVLDFFQRIKGPSLETGLVGVPTTAILHYDLDMDLDRVLGVTRAVK